MKILIIDGQGGRMGGLLAEKIKKASIPGAEIYALGTNSTATAAMLKAGADYGATGENPVLVACRDADIIADALLGEVTPAMAVAVGRSQAMKILLPVNKCSQHVVGVGEYSMSELAEQALSYLLSCIRENLKTTHLAEKATVLASDVLSGLRELERRGLRFDFLRRGRCCFVAAPYAAFQSGRSAYVSSSLFFSPTESACRWHIRI